MSPWNLLLRNPSRFRSVLLLLAIVIILVELCQHPDVRLFERTVGLARAAQPLAAFTPLLVAAVALLAWQLSYRAHLQRERADEQRERADERAEWWRRVQDGVALVTDPEERFRSTGFKLLAGLRHFGPTSAVPYEDVAMLREIIESLRKDVAAGQGASSEAAEPQSRIEEPAPTADEEDDHDGV